LKKLLADVTIACGGAYTIIHAVLLSLMSQAGKDYVFGRGQDSSLKADQILNHIGEGILFNKAQVISFFSEENQSTTQSRTMLLFLYSMCSISISLDSSN